MVTRRGITKDHVPKRSSSYLLQIGLYSFVAHGVMVVVLAILFGLLSVTSYTVAISLSLLITFGFIVTTRFMDMVYTVQGAHYEKRPQIKFLVSSGYYLVTVTVMAVTLIFTASW